MAAGKVITEQNRVGEIRVIGFDDTAECLDYIRDGVVDGTVVQKPNYMGAKAIEMLTQLNREKSLRRP